MVYDKVIKDIVLKDYQLLKKTIFLLIKLKLYSQAMDLISIAANLMYNFNIIYTDDELENALIQISRKLFPKETKFVDQQNNKKVVFYDYFALDNRGLTEQYLQGLIDLNYEILYITLQNDSDKMQNILNKLSNYSSAEIYQVKSDKNILACKEIIESIIKFEPSKILFHSAPWDSIGFVSLCYFEKKVERFLINLTDHAYWLGKCCCDFFIEFRSYGHNISTLYRKISEQKLMVLPYYPITNSNVQFQGFPFNPENKKVIFSGGSLYKIYGSSKYFEIIKYILNTYKESIFLYIGNGDEKPLLNFISENDFDNRMFYSKERKDINEIFKHCYFYLGTYPISGGLMSQYAVCNNKIPIAYTDKNLPINNIEELFINCGDEKFTFTDIDKLYLEIDRLFTDQTYYLKRTMDTKNMVISTKDFALGLQKCLVNKKSDYALCKYEIDIDQVCKIYFDQESNYIHKYENLFFFKKNFLIPLLFKKYFFRYLIKRIKRKIKWK